MDVGFNLLWTFKVYNSLDIFDIDSAGSNVGSNQDGTFTFKAIHDHCPLVLIFAPMQNQGRNGQNFLNKLPYLLAGLLLIGKYEHFALTHQPIQMHSQPLPFLSALSNNHHLLLYILVGSTLLPDVYPYRRTHDIARQELHGLLHGGSEEQGLPVLPGLIDNRSNLLLKAQRKHSVSLINHQVSHSQQICCLFLQHFNQSPRRSHQNI